MKKILHAILQAIVKFCAKGLIIGKKMQNSGLVLYYEIDQFLGFLFQREIAYEPVLQQKLTAYIAEGSLIFDVGANIGQYALWFSTLVPKGKVVCFEPDKKNYAFLSFNVFRNELNNVFLNELGLGESISKETFYRDTKTGGGVVVHWAKNLWVTLLKEQRNKFLSLRWIFKSKNTALQIL